ncbi:hypothetical protein AB0M41_20040, partial [Streptomyces sp. NPDC051896]|uniref:hypothetical protein n=1 Tax=Streptomyces sp. NPDC051896 TaxID=3155416 RepID=UPI0034257604
MPAPSWSPAVAATHDAVHTTSVLPPETVRSHAGPPPQAWCEAAEKIATTSGLPLDAIRVGHLDGDYR